MRSTSLGLASILSASMMLACPGDDAMGDADTGSMTSDGSATGSEASAGATESADGTGDPADAQMLYMTLCSGCHGAEGEGTELGYELRHPVRDYSTWVVRNGRPGGELAPSSMSAYPEGAIDDATLEAIWDYLHTFPQPTTGEGLYLDYCRNCHGADALGGVVGVNISEKTFADAYERVRVGAGLADPGQRMFYMPAFSTDVISDDELQLITEYMTGL